MLLREQYCHSKSSVRPSVSDVELSWSNRLEFLENNFMLVSLGCLLSPDPNIIDLLTLDIKMVQGHFSKMINYTTLCQVSASNRDVLISQWNKCSVVCSGRRRQSIPGMCSHQGEGAIAECWSAHWQHNQRQCWSRRDTAMTLYITCV